MQPVSLIAFGAAICVVGVPTAAAFELSAIFGAAIAILIGTAIGYRLREVVRPARVAQSIRVICVVAATTLIVAVVRS